MERSFHLPRLCGRLSLVFFRLLLFVCRSKEECRRPNIWRRHESSLSYNEPLLPRGDQSSSLSFMKPESPECDVIL